MSRKLFTSDGVYWFVVSQPVLGSQAGSFNAYTRRLTMPASDSLTAWTAVAHGIQHGQSREATKTIGQFWKRKNARRNALTLENRGKKNES
jgi:hypothetical protein